MLFIYRPHKLRKDAQKLHVLQQDIFWCCEKTSYDVVKKEVKSTEVSSDVQFSSELTLLFNIVIDCCSMLKI